MHHARSLVPILLAWLAGLVSSPAQFTIEGVVDKTVYTDSVAFRVTPGAGWNCTATVGTNFQPLGVFVTVATMDFYELRVAAVPTGGGPATNRVVRFIVQSSGRGSPERGLIAWTPYPPVPSTAAELAGASLHVQVPAAWPAGLPLPVVAWLEDPNGTARRANGVVTAEGVHPAGFPLKRGWGSGHFIPGTPGVLNYSPRIQNIGTSRSILIEAAPTWTTVSGLLAGNTVWSTNSRIHVTGHLTVPAGATLTIEAGTIVKLNPLMNITNSGKVLLAGTPAAPVVFTSTNLVAPEQAAHAWGGFVMRNGGEVAGNDAIITGGGGAPSINFGQGTSHRSEQPVLLLHNGARAAFTNVALINAAGQFGNGYNSDLILEHCLFQRAITAGEYVGGNVFINRSAVIEFPADDGVINAAIADADYDGIYFTTGTHVLRNSLFGFAKDDAIDSGSGGAGTMVVTNCWVESALHESMAWSGQGRRTWTFDTVSLNSGQGIEAGWTVGAGGALQGTVSPDCFAERLLSTANAVGARFGDNYDWSYQGFLRITNSLILHNYRDIFARTWNTTGATDYDTNQWVDRLAQMDIRGNWITVPHPGQPGNLVWNPDTDAHRLAAFMSTPPTAPVGIGIALWPHQTGLARLTSGIPVRLSSFTTRPVSVDYRVETLASVVASGSLLFQPGETVRLLPPLTVPSDTPVVRIALSNPTGGEITGNPTTYLGASSSGPAPPAVSLIATGSVWRYWDTNVAPPTGWQNPAFDDSGWRSGAAELGYGDGDERTLIRSTNASGARVLTAYFRHSFDPTNSTGFSGLSWQLRRDDGAVVWLNGVEAFRQNMPSGPIVHTNFAASVVNGAAAERALNSTNTSAAALRPGINVVAVEVHQSDAGSSDISFELALSGQPAGNAPTLRHQRFNNELVLWWNDPASVLEVATNVTGPWAPATPANSPSGQPISGNRFYRLRR